MKKQNRKLSRVVVRATEATEKPVEAELREQVIALSSKVAALESAKAVNGIVQCKDQGIRIEAKKVWECGKEISLQWMPGGEHLIYPSLSGRGGDLPIELAVKVTQASAKNVQAAFEKIKAAAPRRPPFVCVEHRAEERAASPLRFEWMDEPEGGIYLACEPSELGARNVNGKTHTSFSPTFDTDADYSKLKCSACSEGPDSCECNGGRYFKFPVGARGSRSNPAEVTAPDVKSCGALTNWPAFRDILPIAARENKVQAAGTSEGVKKSWDKRVRGHAHLAMHLEDAAQVAEHGGGHYIASIRDGIRGGIHHLPEGEHKEHASAVADYIDARVKDNNVANKNDTEPELKPDHDIAAKARKVSSHIRSKMGFGSHPISRGYGSGITIGGQDYHKFAHENPEGTVRSTSTETHQAVHASLDEAIRAVNPLDAAIHLKFPTNNLDAAIRASLNLSSKDKQAPQLEQQNAETK